MVQDAEKSRKAREEAKEQRVTEDKAQLTSKLERALTRCHQLELELQEAVSAKVKNQMVPKEYPGVPQCTIFETGAQRNSTMPLWLQT